jgi:hypothetical protein
VGVMEQARQKRTPAMAAGLASHVRSLRGWLTFTGIQQLENTTKKENPFRKEIS